MGLDLLERKFTIACRGCGRIRVCTRAGEPGRIHTQRYIPRRGYQGLKLHRILSGDWICRPCSEKLVPLGQVDLFLED